MIFCGRKRGPRWGTEKITSQLLSSHESKQVCSVLFDCRFLLEVLDGKSCSKGTLVFFVLLLNLELRPGGACLPDPRENNALLLTFIILGSTLGHSCKLFLLLCRWLALTAVLGYAITLREMSHSEWSKLCSLISGTQGKDSPIQSGAQCSGTL